MSWVPVFLSVNSGVVYFVPQDGFGSQCLSQHPPPSLSPARLSSSWGGDSDGVSGSSWPKTPTSPVSVPQCFYGDEPRLVTVSRGCCGNAIEPYVLKTTKTIGVRLQRRQIVFFWSCDPQCLIRRAPADLLLTASRPSRRLVTLP